MATWARANRVVRVLNVTQELVVGVIIYLANTKWQQTSKIVRTWIWPRSIQKIILFKIALFVGMVVIQAIQIIRCPRTRLALKADQSSRTINQRLKLMQVRGLKIESNLRRSFLRAIFYLPRKVIKERRRLSVSSKMQMLFLCSEKDCQQSAIKEVIKVKWVITLPYTMILNRCRKRVTNEE